MTRTTIRMRPLTLSLSVLLTLAMLTGCGDSAERRTQRAQIALANGKYDTAIELAETALAKKPDDVPALIVKADAQKRLLKLDAAKTTLDQALAKYPDSEPVRRQAVSWAMVKLGNLLSQSDLSENAQRQAEFDQALSIAGDQARWLREHQKSSAESDFAQARLALADAERIRLKIKASQKSLSAAGATGQPSQALAKAMEVDLANRTQAAMAHFKAVVDADAAYPEAAERYASLLRENRQWSELWVLSQRLAREKTLAPALVAALVQSMLSMPASVQPSEKVLETARVLQQAVEPEKRKSASWRLTDARLLLMGNDVDKAMPVLETIVKDEPKNQTALFLLAQCHFVKKDFPKAKAILQDLVTQVRSPEVQSLYGRTLMELNDLLLAREALRAAIDLNPDDVQARQAFLMLQAKSNNLDQAQADVEEYYRKNPGDPKAIRFKYQFELVRNNRPAIETLLSKVQAIRPLSDEHLSILLEGYGYLQDYAKAQKYAQELVDRQPDVLENHLRLAQVLLLQNQDDRVREMLTELRRRFPRSAGVDQMLAELYLQRGSYDRTVELIEPVVEKEPENDSARMTLVRALAGLNLFDDALTNLKHLLEKSPREARYHMLAGRLYQSMGRMDRANEHLSQIDMANLDERTNAVVLAQLKARAGQLDEALDICQRALAAGNADPAVRQLMAGIYLQKKDAGQAEANLLSLIRAQPNNAEYWVVLGRFYVEQKQIDKGLVEFTNLQALNEPLSRLSQGGLLASVGKLEDSRRVLRPILVPLVKQRNALALSVADSLSRLDQIRKDIPAAIAAYEPLLQADFLTAEARLRQIDLAASGSDEKAMIANYDALAAKLGPDQKRVRFELIRRYANLKQFDRALALVAEWQALQPNQVALARMKADLLRQAERPDQTVAWLIESIGQFPDDVLLRRQLAAEYLTQGQYPKAQQTYLALAELDPGSRINALADLGQMFVALGLNAQASDVFGKLEKEGRINDPRIMLAMGKAYAAMQMNPQAIQRLLEVPDYAQQYAPAQVQAARIEQAMGQLDQARQRLEKLAADPKHSAMASSQLMQMNLRNRQAEELIRWSDQKLATESLPENLRRSWMSVRLSMADSQRDARRLGETIDAFVKAYPSAPQVGAAKVLSLAGGRKPEEARQVYRSWPGLAASPLGPLAAVLVNETPQATSLPLPALDAILVALAQGQVDQAGKAIGSLESQQAVFASDLKALVDRPDAASADMRQSARQLAWALLALRVSLPQTAYDLCDGVLKKMPSLVPAYMIQTQALIEMDQPIEPVAQQMVKSLPNSSTALFAQARDQSANKKYDQAISLLEKLLQRDVDHWAAGYYLSQQLTLAGKYDQAIARLEKLHQQASAQGRQDAGAVGASMQVANDLAYLIAEHQPSRLAEAQALIAKAHEQNRRNPAMLDTVGWIALLSGKSQDALKYLSQAIMPLSSVPEVHYHIAMAYAKEGHTDWARYHLQEAAQARENPIGAKAKEALNRLK